ncbi:MAG: twin-arginine translocase TatA/TatE family subunit [Desulfobacterales bacterium]
MFGIGISEMVVILVIVLLVFGVGKLPEIGGGMGKAIRNFRQAAREEESATPLPTGEKSKTNH